MSDYETFNLGPVLLQSGITLPQTTLAYQTYGTLNDACDNVILMPTFFGGQHVDTELMMASGRALETKKYFIVVPNMLGNGLSSSPSNTPPPFDGPSFPNVTLYDNVTCQHRLLTEHLGIDRVRLVIGFSMGAQQAFQWGSLYPDMVEAILTICGSAKTSVHNYLLLEGAKTALTLSTDYRDGRYETAPVRGLTAFSRVYGSISLCSDFYAEQEYAKLGLASPDETASFFEGFFRQRDANDLLATLWTWQYADVSDNEVYRGDLAAALTATRARTVLMPSSTDFLFQVRDSEAEAAQMPNASLQTIHSKWGHLAGLGLNAPDNGVVDTAIQNLLARG